MFSLLFPEKCVYCGDVILKTSVPICKQCAKKIPVIKGTRCKYCGREQTECFCKIGDYAFVQNVSVLKYDSVAAVIIKRLKFGKKPQLAEFIAREIAQVVKLEYNDVNFDFITFVPMNRYKMFKRGFNQAKVIADNIGCILGIPVVNTLKRKFSFKDQKSKNKKERQKNIKGQFSSLSGYEKSTILLIDDVFTTGSTLNECSRVLKSCGALHVYTATFAITYKK